jgi:imidazolonepropionase-like amidohydrolase
LGTLTLRAPALALIPWLAACASTPRPPAVPAQPTLAFTHVNVVDGRSAQPRLDRTVLVQGNRIIAEAPAGSASVPSGAHVIDGRGNYLIPGLWDMHVHTVMPGGEATLALYVGNGVTGIRDMAGEWEQLKNWRDEIASAARIGPRMILSGPYLEGGDVPIPHLLVRTPDDAQPAVDSLMRLGVDFIKVHSQLTPETYFAIARAARARGIPFAGHVPRSVGAAAASDSGQRSIEHLLTIPNQCTPEEVESLAPRFPVQAALGRCATEDLTPLFAGLVRNETWIVPTIVATVEIALWPNRELPGDSLAHYLPAELRRYVAEIFPMPDDVPPDADVVGRALLQKRAAMVGALHRAGVHLMTGTDAPLRNSPPGFGLHEELEWFVRAGLSPWDALRAATSEPAHFLNMQDSLGTVEAGKIADLVLLEANPLDDIRNTRRIAAVVANGRLFEVQRDVSGLRVQEFPFRSSGGRNFHR